MKDSAITIILIVIIGFLLFNSFFNDNNSAFINRNYDYAYIYMPDKSIIEGKVDKWNESYKTGNITIVIDGTTYFTSSNRVVLVKKSGGK